MRKGFNSILRVMTSALGAEAKLHAGLARGKLPPVIEGESPDVGNRNATLR